MRNWQWNRSIQSIIVQISVTNKQRNDVVGVAGQELESTTYTTWRDVNCPIADGIVPFNWLLYNRLYKWKQDRWVKIERIVAQPTSNSQFSKCRQLSDCRWNSSVQLIAVQWSVQWNVCMRTRHTTTTAMNSQLFKRRQLSNGRRNRSAQLIVEQLSVQLQAHGKWIKRKQTCISYKDVSIVNSPTEHGIVPSNRL